MNIDCVLFQIARRVTIILSISVFLVGCGQQTNKSQEDTPAPTVKAASSPAQPIQQASQPDPVASVKQILNRLQDSCSRGEVIRCHFDGGRFEDHAGKPLRNVRFDVQRTSSLVSPYLAQVSFDNPGDDSGSFTRFDIALAFQDGKWVLTDLRDRHWNGMLGEWSDTMKRDQLMREIDQNMHEMAVDEFRQRMGVQ